MDAFFSYSHKDKANVSDFIKCLVDRGIDVWLDVDRIEIGEDFTRCITEQLPMCRCLLVWYSPNYKISKACQWELQSAYLAAQQRGQPWSRILILNPEENDQHILLPSGLSVQNRLSVNNPSEYAKAAGSVLNWLAKISSPFGMLVPRASPVWHGRSADHISQYVGRVLDMWSIDELLHGGNIQNAAADLSISSVQIRGLA